MLSVLCMYTCKVYSIHQRARRCLLINVSGHRHVFFQGFTPQFPWGLAQPPSPLTVAGTFRWPTVISVSASQSKSSSVCYSSHRRWETAVAALLGGGGRYAARGGSSGGRWTSLLVGTLVQLYIYEKLRWISYKCVYVCPYWMAIVTPLFEATDRPGVPTSSVLRRNSTECHNRTDTSMKSYFYFYTFKIQRDTSESFLWFCRRVTILETSRDILVEKKSIATLKCRRPHCVG